MKVHRSYLLTSVLIALVCKVIFSYYAQINMEEAYSEGSYSWYNKVGYFGDFLLSICGVVSLARYYDKFPKLVVSLFFSMLGLVVLTSLRDIDSLFKPSFFYSQKGIGTWLNFSLIFIAGNKQVSRSILDFFLLLCYFFAIVNVVQLISLGVISDRNQALFAIRDTTVFLIWVFPFFFLNNFSKNRLNKALLYIVMIITVFCSFAIASRSYLFISLTYLCIRIYRDFRSSSHSKYLSILFLLIPIYFISINSDFFQSISGFVDVFVNRVSDDSRSSQLTEFLDQFDIDYLFVGVGPVHTWHWSSVGDYEWLDNQYLLITWWFGLPVCVLYVIFLFLVLRKYRKDGDENVNNVCIVLFFWFLACGGFAIYVTIGTKLFNYFLSLLIGMSVIQVNGLVNNRCGIK